MANINKLQEMMAKWFKKLPDNNGNLKQMYIKVAEAQQRELITAEDTLLGDDIDTELGQIRKFQVPGNDWYAWLSFYKKLYSFDQWIMNHLIITNQEEINKKYPTLLPAIWNTILIGLDFAQAFITLNVDSEGNKSFIGWQPTVTYSDANGQTSTAQGIPGGYNFMLGIPTFDKQTWDWGTKQNKIVPNTGTAVVYRSRTRPIGNFYGLFQDIMLEVWYEKMIQNNSALKLLMLKIKSEDPNISARELKALINTTKGYVIDTSESTDTNNRKSIEILENKNGATSNTSLTQDYEFIQMAYWQREGRMADPVNQKAERTNEAEIDAHLLQTQPILRDWLFWLKKFIDEVNETFLSKELKIEYVITEYYLPKDQDITDDEDIKDKEESAGDMLNPDNKNGETAQPKEKQ